MKVKYHLRAAAADANGRAPQHLINTAALAPVRYAPAIINTGLQPGGGDRQKEMRKPEIQPGPIRSH